MLPKFIKARWKMSANWNNMKMTVMKWKGSMAITFGQLQRMCSGSGVIYLDVLGNLERLPSPHQPCRWLLVNFESLAWH